MWVFHICFIYYTLYFWSFHEFIQKILFLRHITTAELTLVEIMQAWSRRTCVVLGQWRVMTSDVKRAEAKKCNFLCSVNEKGESSRQWKGCNTDDHEERAVTYNLQWKFISIIFHFFVFLYLRLKFTWNITEG